MIKFMEVNTMNIFKKTNNKETNTYNRIRLAYNGIDKIGYQPAATDADPNPSFVEQFFITERRQKQ